MPYRGMLQYPGDPRWGSVSKMTSRPKTLEQTRTHLSREETQQFDRAVSSLVNPDNHRLEGTIFHLSDKQFKFMIGRIRFLALIPGRLAFGIEILAGLNPSPQDHGLWPDVPQVACKERKKMDTGPQKGTVEWVMLQERMKTLPLELFLAIEKMSYDGAFLADIFPHKGTEGLTLKPYIGKDINLKALGLIDRSSHAEYANRVGTENLWIISPGPELLTIGFLRYESARIRRSAFDSLADPSAKVYSRVKRVHLALSREDSSFAKSFIAKTSDLLFPHTRGYCDRWLLFMEFDSNNKDVLSQIDRDLLDRWGRKLHTFSGMDSTKSPLT